MTTSMAGVAADVEVEVEVEKVVRQEATGRGGRARSGDGDDGRRGAREHRMKNNVMEGGRANSTSLTP